MKNPQTLILLSKAFEKDSQFINRISKALEKHTLKYISDLKDFESIVFNEAYSPSYIFIGVDLDWFNDSSLDGYAAAEELLKKCSDRTFFQLYFFSTFSRENLNLQCHGIAKLFNQIFIHIDLLSSNIQLPTHYPPMCLQRFRYVREYCLTQSGIFDFIAHDIDYIYPKPEKAHLQNILERLEELDESIVGKDNIDHTVNMIEQFDPEKLSETQKELSILRGRLLDLSHHVQGKTHSTTRVSPAEFQLMVVEDEPKMAEKIKNAFEIYFKKVVIFDNAYDAFIELKDHSLHYHGAIFDLLFLEQRGIWQPVSGFELLEMCIERYPYIAPRIISGMPRRTLQYLPSGFSHKNILPKSLFNEHYIDEFQLENFAKRLKKEILKRQKNFSNMTGSDIGPFSPEKQLKNHYYILKSESENEFKSMVGKIVEKAKAFIKGELDDVPIEQRIATKFPRASNMSNPTAWPPYLETILLHRLIVFFKAKLSDSNVIHHYSDDDDAFSVSPGFANELPKGINEYYNTRLGIHVQELKNSNKISTGKAKIYINEEELFPHEKKVLDEFNPRDYQLLKSRKPEIYAEVELDIRQFLKTIYIRIKKFDSSITEAEFTQLAADIKVAQDIIDDRDFEVFADAILDSNDRLNQ